MLELLRHALRIFVILPILTPVCLLIVLFLWAVGDKRERDRIIEFYIESLILGRTL